MLFVLHRVPKPDARQWRGRRWLAAADAVLWPAFWIALIVGAAEHTGLVGRVIIVLLVLYAALRLARAIGRNERYWFSTWRWAKFAFVVVAVGLALATLTR